MMKIPTHIGVDFSMTSPALCVIEPDGYTRIDYVTQIKKLQRFENSIDGYEFAGYAIPDKRRDHDVDIMEFNHALAYMMATQLQHYVDKSDNDYRLFIEGYSYGSVGRGWSIGESTGELKQHLRLRMIDYDVLAPSTIKKLYTGFGNANKKGMYHRFMELTGIELTEAIEGHMYKSPISDMVDAHAIAWTQRMKFIEDIPRENDYKASKTITNGQIYEN